MTAREQSADRGARVGAEVDLGIWRERAEFWTTRDPSTIGYLYDETAVKFAGEVMYLLDRLEATEALADTFEKRARMASIDANTERSRRANNRARTCDAVMQTWLDARAELRAALGEQGTTSAEETP